jgi:hypothetical protein
MGGDDERERAELRQRLSDDLKHTIEDRIDRYLEISHQGIIPGHHFAAASSECVNLYRDGYFLSAVMVSQSVAEGIWRFVLERNSITADAERPQVAASLVTGNVISQACADAFVRIWRSFRNDVHHMNPKVAAVPFKMIASRNLGDLAAIERELFAIEAAEDGRLRPLQPKYWDIGPDGTTSIFLRL